MSGDDEGPRRPRSGATARAERLAAELKANLKKRKEQARARQSAGRTDASPPAPGKDKTDT